MNIEINDNEYFDSDQPSSDSDELKEYSTFNRIECWMCTNTCWEDLHSLQYKKYVENIQTPNIGSTLP